MDNLIQSVVIGSGGHARSIISLIKAQGRFQVAGVLSVEPVVSVDEKICGVDLLGDLELLSDLSANGVVNAHLALGSSHERRKYSKLLAFYGVGQAS